MFGGERGVQALSKQFKSSSSKHASVTSGLLPLNQQLQANMEPERQAAAWRASCD